MPHGRISEEIPAKTVDVFKLLHDYNRRLEWDTLLQSASLLNGFTRAQLGAVSSCRGRGVLGGFELITEYVTFRPPDVAAVRMINRPPFFELFAATIRHVPLADNSSTIEYVYNFTARPRWLRFILHPLMNLLFKIETRKRLRALRRYLGSSHRTD